MWGRRNLSPPPVSKNPRTHEALLDDPKIRPRSPAKTAGRLALLLWIAVVAGLTLLPGDARSGSEPFLCFPCGDRGTADAVLNAFLFAPAGALAAGAGIGVAATAAFGFGLSAAIEAIQTLLPGRYPTAADVVFNGFGAVLGLLAVRGLRSRLFEARGVAFAAGVLLLLTAWLAQPAPPPGILFGQHTPQLGRLPAYDGRVLEALVGTVAVPSWAMEDSHELRMALGAEADIRLRFVVGSGTRGWSPVFAVFSGASEEAVFVAVRGDDVLVRSRTRAAALRFRQPGDVMRGGLGAVAEGDTVLIGVAFRREGRCILGPESQACGLGVGSTEGWRYLLGGEGWDEGWLRVFSILWTAVPLTLLLMARGPVRHKVFGVVGLFVAALVLPLATSLSRVVVSDLLWGGGLALVLGWFLSRGRGMRGSERPGPASPQ